MVTNRVRMSAAGFVACAALAMPAEGLAQSRYADDDAPAVVVECAPGQRAVMAQRRVNGTSQIVARCEGTVQAVRARAVSRARVQYADRAPQPGAPTTPTLRRGVERTKTKAAL